MQNERGIVLLIRKAKTAFKCTAAEMWAIESKHYCGKVAIQPFNISVVQVYVPISACIDEKSLATAVKISNRHCTLEKPSQKCSQKIYSPN